VRFAGVDVGKHHHVVAVLEEDGRKRVAGPLKLTADKAGFERLLSVLGEPGAVHMVMEASGHYGCNLFAWLAGNGQTVSVVNAALPARFARVELRRAKTDNVDAAGLARYGLAMRPAPSRLPDEETDLLRELARWRAGCVEDRGDKVRRLHRQMDLAFPEAGRDRRPFELRTPHPQ
jgi:transposase